MSVKGTASTIKKLLDLPNELRAGIGKALAISVIEMDAHAKEKIQGGSRGGRTYRRGTVTHRASAPGEFPKTDRGQLVASLFFQVADNRLSAHFGSALPYARYLEYGTSRLAARPWLRPTFQTYHEKANDRIRDAVADALRKAAARG